MLNRTKVLAAGAAAVGTAALLVGPIGAAAQEDDDPTETTTAPPGSDEPAADEPAADIGAAWLEEAVGTLVTSGMLTQEQADAVVAAIGDARPAPGEWRGGRGHHGSPMLGHWRAGLEAAATAIGIDEDDLRDAVRDGQTLAEVAEANGVDPQVVIDALVADATARIDEALAEGRIDEAEATERTAEVEARITAMVEDGFPARGDGVGPRDDGDHGDDGDDIAGDTASTPDSKLGDTTATTDGGS